jgi:hypothetical protein
MKPQGMTVMARTGWPSRIDEVVVNVLLRILDDPLGVRLGFVVELAQPPGVLKNKLIVFASNCCVQVAKEQVDNSPLVGISYRHRLFDS